MRVPSIRVLILAAGLGAFMIGCMVPEYRLPQGFSSSYHRQLYGMDPVVVGGIPEDQIPLNPPPGVFVPGKILMHDPPAEVQQPERSSAKTPRVMIQPPQSGAKTAPRR